MKVILLETIDKVGDANTVVEVADGFGLNYLLPRRLAIIANESNSRLLKDRIEEAATAEAEVLAEAKAFADKLKAAKLRIPAKAGSSGKIFGSVTNVQLAGAIREVLGVDIERKFIELPEDIKMLGMYTATIKLHKKLEADFEFEVFEDDK